MMKKPYSEIGTRKDFEALCDWIRQGGWVFRSSDDWYLFDVFANREEAIEEYADYLEESGIEIEDLIADNNCDYGCWTKPSDVNDFIEDIERWVEEDGGFPEDCE